MIIIFSFFSFCNEEGRYLIFFLALATELTASQLSLMKVQIMFSLMLSLLALWQGGFLDRSITLCRFLSKKW